MASIEPGEPHDWHSVESVDDWIAFDRLREKDRVPGLQFLAGLIPFGRDEAIRVLAIGAGYGLLSRVILEAFPGASVTCHDYSEPMFTVAREALKGFAGRASWVKADLLALEWTRVLEGPFDAIVSSIAIHNVRSPERIRSIYRELFAFIKEGGCFLNMEHVGPAGNISARFYHEARTAERQRILNELERTHQGAQEAKQEWPDRRHREAVGATSLEAHLRWLHEAGFEEVDCYWKKMGRAIIGGYRSPQTCEGLGPEEDDHAS
ncbi:MAG: class I SAM-dependent methyltransferase [Dehalococcoidia bacterium]|nr:class I SAM-dependent methyltransferase [Dehalococcoidia bacterium]